MHLIGADDFAFHFPDFRGRLNIFAMLSPSIMGEVHRTSPRNRRNGQFPDTANGVMQSHRTITSTRTRVRVHPESTKINKYLKTNYAFDKEDAKWEMGHNKLPLTGGLYRRISYKNIISVPHYSEDRVKDEGTG